MAASSILSTSVVNSFLTAGASYLLDGFSGQTLGTTTMIGGFSLSTRTFNALLSLGLSQISGTVGGFLRRYAPVTGRGAVFEEAIGPFSNALTATGLYSLSVFSPTMSPFTSTDVRTYGDATKKGLFHFLSGSVGRQATKMVMPAVLGRPAAGF